jgi:hypothetical protein
MLHHVDGGGRHQARHLDRANRRLLLQRGPDVAGDVVTKVLAQIREDLPAASSEKNEQHPQPVVAPPHLMRALLSPLSFREPVTFSIVRVSAQLTGCFLHPPTNPNEQPQDLVHREHPHLPRYHHTKMEAPLFPLSSRASQLPCKPAAHTCKQIWRGPFKPSFGLSGLVPTIRGSRGICSSLNAMPFLIAGLLSGPCTSTKQCSLM